VYNSSINIAYATHETPLQLSKHLIHRVYWCIVQYQLASYIAVNRTPLAVSARQAKTWHVMHFIHYVAGELSDLCVVTACFARSARESVVVVVWLFIKPRLHAVTNSLAKVAVHVQVLTDLFIADCRWVVLRLTMLKLAPVRPLLSQLCQLTVPPLNGPTNATLIHVDMVINS